MNRLAIAIIAIAILLACLPINVQAAPSDLNTCLPVRNLAARITNVARMHGSVPARYQITGRTSAGFVFATFTYRRFDPGQRVTVSGIVCYARVIENARVR